MSEQHPNYPRAKSVPPVKHIISLPYEFRPFPAARYHPDGRSVLVNSQEQADALGEEWAATPFPAPSPPIVEAPKCPGCAERDATLRELIGRYEALVAAHQAEIGAHRGKLANKKKGPAAEPKQE